MYPHKGLLHLHWAEETIWLKKLNETRFNGSLCSWISTLHPQKLPCRTVKGEPCNGEWGWINGSFNFCQKLIFDDDTCWILRLPRIANVSPQYADEKTMMETVAFHLIREKTSIPVPAVRAWGLSKDNPLGLGPFILMDFINGISLKDVFADKQTGLLKESIPDEDVERIYRKMAQYMLELFQIDFSQIGSLPTPRQPECTLPAEPLTFKANTTIHDGGVDVFGAFR